MGQKQIKEDQSINRNAFEFQYVVGKGGFGKVWKVVLKKLKKEYALKEMSKAKIIDKKSHTSINYERELLSHIKHPFIVNMLYAFQDHDNLYLVMDLLTGGDLRYHVSKKKKFSEEESKFFICCILLALEYIHHNNILHRDIKPENIVLDEKGYLRLTDFGIAKYYCRENSSETSGTPGYMSPEVMCGLNHTVAVDYFALGVIAYELMMGIRPYTGKSRKEIKEKIMARQVQVKKQDVPGEWSYEAADFINRLLQRKPANRLGLRGAAEVKEHPWLKYYPWKDLYEKKIDSPYKPKFGDNFDATYCNNPDKIGLQTRERYDNYLRDEKLKEIFKNFMYIDYEDLRCADTSSPSKTKKSQQDLKEKRLNNPHLNLSNFNEKTMKNSSNDLTQILNIKLGNRENFNACDAIDSLNKNAYLNNSKMNLEIDLKKQCDETTSHIEKEFIRMKKQSNSATTMNLLRQYRQANISQNSTNVTSSLYMKKEGSSTSNN